MDTYIYRVSAATEPGSTIRFYFDYERRLDADAKAYELRTQPHVYDVNVRLSYYEAAYLPH